MYKARLMQAVVFDPYERAVVKHATERIKKLGFIFGGVILNMSEFDF